MANVVIGVFSKRIDAERAIYDLDTLGYDPQKISVLEEQSHQTKNKGIMEGFMEALTGETMQNEEVVVAVPVKANGESQIKEIFEAYDVIQVRTIKQQNKGTVSNRDYERSFYGTPAFYSDIRRSKKKRKVF